MANLFEYIQYFKFKKGENLVASVYSISPDAVNYWADSTNCLFWITSPSTVSKTFLSNRVGEIQNELKQEM
jgi:hypothetical protein